MPYVDGWMRARVWVAESPPPLYPDNSLPVPPPVPGVPAHPIELPPPYPDQGLPVPPPHPDQGLPVPPPHPDQGLPPHPDHGLPVPPLPVDPDWGVDEGAHPDQGLPEPPPSFPIIPSGDDIEGHPDLPDLGLPGGWAWVKETQPPGYTYQAWIISPVDGEVPPDHEPVYPDSGEPGTWVTVLVSNLLAWAWIPTPTGTEPPEEQRRKFKS